MNPNKNVNYNLLFSVVITRTFCDFEFKLVVDRCIIWMLQRSWFVLFSQKTSESKDRVISTAVLCIF